MASIEGIIIQHAGADDPDPTQRAREMSRDCLEESLNGERVTVLDGGTDVSLETVLSVTSAEMLLVLYDDQIIMNSSAVSVMTKILGLHRDVAAVGPMSYQATNPVQRGGPNSIYHNRHNYYEIATEYEREGGVEVKASHTLDSCCALYPRSFLEKLPRNTPWAKVQDAISAHKMPLLVALGAFVHRFDGLYDHKREDLIKLIPSDAKCILDVGCSKGGMGQLLKEERDCHITGLEIDPVLAAAASEILDEVLVASVEDAMPPGPFDCIVCGDVLEHLIEPWDTLAKLRQSLSDNGALIASIPNVQHWSIVKDLLEGHWEYIPAGLLYVGHLRFFTRLSIEGLFKKTGFSRVELFPKIEENPSSEGRAFIKSLCGSNRVSSPEDLKALCFLIRAWSQQPPA